MKRAILLGAIASLLWSTVFVIGRYLCDVLGLHPILVAFLRFSCASAVSVLYILLKGEARSLALLVERPLTIILLAITGITCMGSAVFWALSLSTSVDVSIIMNSNAIFIIPLASLIGERFTLRKGVGVVTGLLGCALVINGGITGFQLTNREYVTARKLSDRPTSRTLATCFCYNRFGAVGPAGPWPAWYGSHVRGQFLFNQGVPFDPKPDGLVVGYLDGACRFVNWRDLSPSNHAGQYIVYYDSTY